MLKPTQTLPAIVVITGMKDFGPSDGEGSATCPHCGANGRYVWTFICADGSHRGAMRGYLQLFPQAAGSSRYSRLIQERNKCRLGPSPRHPSGTSPISRYHAAMQARQIADDFLPSPAIIAVSLRYRSPGLI